MTQAEIIAVLLCVIHEYERNEGFNDEELSSLDLILSEWEEENNVHRTSNK